MRVAKEPSLALSNQLWRTFLSIDNAVLGKGETKASLRRQEFLDIILPSSDIYPGVERRSELMGPIIWRYGVPLRSAPSYESGPRDFMGAIRGKLHSQIAVPGPSRLSRSGLIGQCPTT
jgi:hypothetical protein